MMENGFTDDQPLRSKSNKKKKRKRDRENKPEDQPDSQETGGSEGVEVNNEEASTENTDENMENGVPDDQPPRSKSKKKKKKRERENDLDYQLDSQETLESENIEENGLLVEGTPKKKRKKEHENKTERQPSTEENPESVSVKGKVKKPNKKGPRTFKQIYPDEILKLEEQFLKEHNDERFANNAAKFLTPEDREIMKNNWISFFKDHPHPDPRELIRMKHKYDEKTRAEMDTFIAEHNFYKRLVQGIEDNPVRILRTAIRSFPYRSKPQREKKESFPKPPLGTKLNRDWSEEDNIIFRDFIVEEMTDQENTTNIPFAKVKRKIPFMNAGRCKTQWKNVTCWQIDHKWRVRSEPFSADHKRRLVEGVRDQRVASEEEINWKKLSKEFPDSSRKELKYYWRNLVKLNRYSKLSFQDTIHKLHGNVTSQKTKIPAIGKTKVDKLQIRKESLQHEIDSIKSKITALQTRLEKAETNLIEVTAQIDKREQNGTEEVVPVVAEVDPGLDSQKTQATTEAEDTPKPKGRKTKTTTEAEATPKPKRGKNQNTTEVQATPKTKPVKTKNTTEAEDTPKTKGGKTKTTTEAEATPKPKRGKKQNTTEVQATPKTTTETETLATPKAKTVKAKSVTEAQATPKTKNVTKAQATPKTKTVKTKSVPEVQDTPKTTTVTEAKTVTEAEVDVFSNSFMDVSSNPLSRFFDDDEL